MNKSREPIRLRQRELKTGGASLYLDIYIDGVRRYEYLKLYLVPESTREDKEKNRQTIQLAEAIKAKRVVDLQNDIHGFQRQDAGKTRFFDYYIRMCEERKQPDGKGGNWGNWYSCLHHLRIYERRSNITFGEINGAWVRGFREYLDKRAVAWASDDRKLRKDKPLSQNSKASYFNKVRACIRQALEERIITINPLVGIDGFKELEGTRMYLTLEEVKRLAITKCDNEDLKKAFLFSCLTGLRRSDIERLKWVHVYKQGEYTRIIFRQKKTGQQEYLDINKQAEELMGERGAPDSYVFRILTPSSANACIKTWCARAGIDKEITFHCGRHTFATMMLDLGTDIYTVSKLLGHKQLNTTQRYTKVLDKNKQAAVSNIPDIIKGA